MQCKMYAKSIKSILAGTGKQHVGKYGRHAWSAEEKQLVASEAVSSAKSVTTLAPTQYKGTRAVATRLAEQAVQKVLRPQSHRNKQLFYKNSEMKSVLDKVETEVRKSLGASDKTKRRKRKRKQLRSPTTNHSESVETTRWAEEHKRRLKKT